MADPWSDATGQAELVRSGEASPVELLDETIARIEKLDPELNAVVRPLFEKARRAAASDLPDGPFGGVPMLVKDGLLTTEGDPLHNGMRVLRDAGWVEEHDSWTAQRYRRAGFVLVGKTNLPELATIVTTESLAHGPTRNPWDPSRSPGGSSGGSGAAVAAGMVAVAHGTDMGGSIRIPASACGLVGLKPSRARGTLGPEFGEYWGPTTHEHVLTRTVRDTAGVLDAVAGPGTGDPYTAPPPERPLRDEVGRDPGRLRIGCRTEQREGRGAPHAECVAAVEATAGLLEELGHDVEDDAPAALDDARLGEGFGTMFPAVIARDLERWSDRLGRTVEPDELEPMNRVLAELGRGVTASQWLRGLEAVQAYARDVCAWWEEAGHDLLVTPTLPDLPPRLGELGPDQDGMELLVKVGGWAGFTLPFNVTGQPAVSLPLHWSEEGLAVGVQLVAAPWREDVLLRVAAQLEAVRPWRDRHPTVSAG